MLRGMGLLPWAWFLLTPGDGCPVIDAGFCALASDTEPTVASQYPYPMTALAR